MDLSQLTIEQLKAMGFDAVTLLGNAQNTINAIQQELARREQKSVPNADKI